MGNPLMPSLTSRMVPSLPSEVTQGGQDLGVGVCPRGIPPYTISFPPGLYCYELDEKAVRPGYPKLIRDVWGIQAASCVGPGKTIFHSSCEGKLGIALE